VAQRYADFGRKNRDGPPQWRDAGPRGAFGEVAAMAGDARGTVIFLPSVAWTVSLRQRTHHLAREFARQGYLVVYDCTGCLHPDAQGFRCVEPNLLIFHGRRKQLATLPGAMLWTLPYNFHLKDEFPPHFRTVYDWIDDLEVFQHHGRGLVARNHRRALAEASQVAAVARHLHREALRVRPDALYLPNGVEVDHFAAQAEVPDDPQLRPFREEGKPVAGYYGALASWFDYGLLERTAAARPDWNFLLVGADYDGSMSGHPLWRLGNVKWIGPRPYESLPGYLRLFDVAMIPFVLNDITRATSPLKLYEFFAAGKPVIATAMPECQAYGEVHIVASARELSQSLNAALAESKSGEFRARLRRIGRENSWSERVRTVCSAGFSPFLRATG
jgi:glycosyltransferase involved in cell wall biosynthesis